MGRAAWRPCQYTSYPVHAAVSPVNISQHGRLVVNIQLMTDNNRDHEDLHLDWVHTMSVAALPTHDR